MVKPTKRVREEETYEADDFVENDDGSAPKAKKTKKSAAPSKTKDDPKSWEVCLPVVKLDIQCSDSIRSSLLARIRGKLRCQSSRVLDLSISANSTRRMASFCLARR